MTRSEREVVDTGRPGGHHRDKLGVGDLEGIQVGEMAAKSPLHQESHAFSHSLIGHTSCALGLLLGPEDTEE